MDRAYSFDGDEWHERYVGHGSKRTMIQHLKDVGGLGDHWAIMHLACDLSPAEAHGLTARSLASTLVKFNDIRKRLRGEL